MSQSLRFDFSMLLLRLSVGGLMLLHGLAKLQHGHDVIAQMLAGAGLPTFLQYGVPVGEVIAPIFVMLGLFTMPSALIIAFTMIFSIFLAFGDRLFTLNQTGGWIVELNVLFLVGALVIALLGAGRFALGRGKLA